ncbi:MAG: 2-dehydropantoate 2-reductase [Bacteroidaceae bacterium]|nr:2-dehydropantoate 2-reductase [Bacteroidaceae bacterium]MBQ8191475.1 2-dehydropantoate 2-reductase [Bacteroidaceae bacterium]
MKYAIIGTGAVGGYYGGRLAHAGNEVHFLLHSDYDYVHEHGLQVDSCDGSFHLDAPNIYHTTADMPKVDVVIVALKTTRNHMLKELLPPLLHPETLVLLIQNGIGPEPILQQQFPNLYLAAGLAFICSAKTEPGRVNHQCYGSINIGNYSCKNQQIVDRLIQDFTEAGIKAASIEYHEARWKKAVWNMPFNGMTVVMNAQTNQLLANPATMQLIRRQMMEVIGAAQALGVKGLDESFADRMIEMTLSMTPYSPSMKLDYDFHRPMEIDYLYSNAIAEAHRAGYTMPCLEMLEAQLRFLQEK